MKDAERTSFAEFEKQFNKNYPLPPTIERGPIGRDFKKGCKKMWIEALEWIYYEGVLNHSLAGGLIKEELPDGRV